MILEDKPLISEVVLSQQVAARIGEARASDAWAPASAGFEIHQTRSEIVQTLWIQIKTLSNFDRSKNDLPGLRQIEISYGFEDFEERNNFLHRNVLGYELDFEWKFRETLGYEFGSYLIGFLLGMLKFGWNLD
jgi:hypothetical protein